MALSTTGRAAFLTNFRQARSARMRLLWGVHSAKLCPCITQTAVVSCSRCFITPALFLRPPSELLCCAFLCLNAAFGCARLPADLLKL